MDIREQGVAKLLIEEIESDQFRQRREDEYKSYKVAEGGQLPYVMDRLQELFPKSWETMRVSDISISNKVLNKVAKAYKESPIRTMGEQTKKVNEVLDEAMINDVMAEFDRDFNRQRYGLLWVNSIENEPKLHSLKGFESFAKVNKQTGDLELVVVNYPDTEITSGNNSDGDMTEQHLAESQDDTSAETRVYAMWTREFHAVWKIETKDQGKTTAISSVEVPGNETMKNPLGVIPFVYRSKSSSVDLPFLNQLTEQSITYNILSSDLLTAMALQGYGQLVVTLPEDTSIETMSGGMTTAITLPIIMGAEAQADAKYINPSPDLAGMKETINNYSADILSEHGIEAPSTGGAQQFPSALDRIVASADVSDVISMNQRVYAGMEKEIVEILIAYGVLTSKNKDLSTVFTKPKVMISDSETLANIKTRLELGLITKQASLQIIDPNLSDEDAALQLDIIADENKDAVSAFMELGNGSKGNDETKDRPKLD